MSLFAGDMILYIENPKDSTKKEPALINVFIKAQDIKLISRNQLHFLYINNELTETEMNKTIPLTIASKGIKYLGINLTKDVKDL